MARSPRRRDDAPPGRRAQTRSTALTLALTLCLALLFRSFVAEANVIPSGSMQPTLLVGDRVVVAKFVYGLKLPSLPLKLTQGREPRRGEVVVFVHPDTGETLIKRAVALGGDTVAMERGQLTINGRPVPRRPLPGPCTTFDQDDLDAPAAPVRCLAFEEHLGEQRYTVLQHPDSGGGSFRPRKVPEGHVFVLGDNRDNSNDSRFWGTVPHNQLKGRALFYLWSYGQPEGLRWERFFQPVHHDAAEEGAAGAMPAER